MENLNRPPTLLRAAASGLAGGVTWLVAMTLFFGPAQMILANPQFQSDKFLYVVTQLEPLPRAATAWWILPAGVLLIAMLHGIAYHFVRGAFSGLPGWGKGVRFGLVVWMLMVPWFLFYLPWNVMHEPFLLVMLEMVLWLAVLLCAGLAISLVYERKAGTEPATG
jgi:hypothetical protein